MYAVGLIGYDIRGIIQVGPFVDVVPTIDRLGYLCPIGSRETREFLDLLRPHTFVIVDGIVYVDRSLAACEDSRFPTSPNSLSSALALLRLL